MRLPWAVITAATIYVAMMVAAMIAAPSHHCGAAMTPMNDGGAATLSASDRRTSPMPGADLHR